MIALACSKPPTGRATLDLRLLENKVVELGIVDRASDSTIGKHHEEVGDPLCTRTRSRREESPARKAAAAAHVSWTKNPVALAGTEAWLGGRANPG